MGMDMYACRLRKVTDKEKEYFIKHVGNIKETSKYANVFPIPESWIVNDPSLYKDIMDLLTPVQVFDLDEWVLRDELDFPLIKNHFGIPQSYEMRTWKVFPEKQVIVYRFADEKREHYEDVTIRLEDLEAFGKPMDYYLIYRVDLECWHKCYDLIDGLDEEYENGVITLDGYHKCNYKMIELLKNYKDPYYNSEKYHRYTEYDEDIYVHRVGG